MPIYASRCPSCGKRTDEFRHVAEHDQQPTCSCGTRMVRDLAAQVTTTGVRGAYAHPIISDAMGFPADAEDVAEHRRRFPNIDLDVSEGIARPVLRSLGQKRAYLKAMKWVDKRAFC